MEEADYNSDRAVNQPTRHSELMASSLSIDPLYTGYFVGGLALALGALAFYMPSTMAGQFGLPLPTRSAEPLVQVKGARDISIGLAYLLFGYQGNAQAVGVLVICHALVGVFDALIVWNHGVRQQVWGHVFGAGLLAALSWSILSRST